MVPLDADILDALPHRPPFRFITGDVRITPGESGSAIWSVTGQEAFFAGHFPECPIVPGVLLSEALAQLSGLVAFWPLDDASVDTGSTRRLNAGAGNVRGADPVKLAHIDIRFIEAVHPPARIELSSRLIRSFGGLRQFDVEAAVDGQAVAHGTLAITLPK